MSARDVTDEVKKPPMISRVCDAGELEKLTGEGWKLREVLRLQESCVTGFFTDEKGRSTQTTTVVKSDRFLLEKDEASALLQMAKLREEAELRAHAAEMKAQEASAKLVATQSLQAELERQTEKADREFKRASDALWKLERGNKIIELIESAIGKALMKAILERSLTPEQLSELAKKVTS